MSIYKVDLDYQTEIEADTPEEAEELFFQHYVNAPQETAETFIAGNLNIAQIRA